MFINDILGGKSYSLFKETDDVTSEKISVAKLN